MADKTDVQHLVKQLMAGATPEEGKALLDALMSGQVTSIFEKLQRDERPELSPIPERTRGFRVRLDLHGAKPPIWRRLELPGDLTLPRVHVAIQAAMGWYDSHLHRFRIANDHRSAYFATEFDLDEGDGIVVDPRAVPFRDFFRAQPVAPDSLYRAQLQQRLGADALARHHAQLTAAELGQERRRPVRCRRQ